ncbi:MAG: hypothetical protein RJA59_1876, partial [Pseudomonadota bacterium]
MDRHGQPMLVVGESRDRRVSKFTSDVSATCTRRHLLGCSDSVLVAFSGGPDSTALLSALAAMRNAGELRAVAALHVDHGLRAGSHLDAAACAQVCEKLSVPFRSVRVEVGG